ncbi:MAG TPA: hypothetical protein VFF69_05090 [Phycisphaerales bacterium]|nr:hypothetical protein [Phycisphaerales bacterium]
MQIGTPWMFWTGLGLALGGIAGLLWALSADWLRGRRGRRPRRRCARCWYDMSRVPGLRCPECGYCARRERALARSRRRWRRAFPCAVLLVAGAAGILNGPIGKVAWAPLAPSALLVRMLKDPAPPDWSRAGGATQQARIRAEVLRRYAAGELSLANRRILAAKQFVPGLPPVSVRTRRVWPAGSRIQVALIPKFGGVQPREFEAWATFAGAERIVAYHGGMRNTSGPSSALWRERPGWSGGVQCIGAPPGELAEIEFEGRILEAGEEIWRGRWVENVRVAGSAGDVFLPAASPELDRAVREAAERSLRLTADRRAVVISPPADAGLVDTAVTLAIEFRRDDEVRAGARLSWVIDASTAEYLGLLARNPDRGDFLGRVPSIEAPIEGDLADAADAPERWTVRISGEPDLLGRSFLHERYWSGQFEIPLGVLLARGE